MVEELNQYDKQDNRETILNCAIHLFYSKGYDAVSVQEIVDAAGITKPTLYYYFKSKYGLLESILEERCDRINQQLRSISDVQGDVPKALFKVAEFYFQLAAREKEFYFLVIALFYSARENEAYRAVKPYMTEQLDIVRNIFEQSSITLGNMNGRQEQFAIGFTGIVHHYILVYYEREERGDKLVDHAAIFSLVHQFMHGIYS